MKRLQRSAALCVAATFTASGAFAQGEGSAWPAKPVRIVVPLAPGGANDITARLLAPGLGEVLGRPVVVENRLGAGGSVGAALVAREPADGYTILIGNISTNAIIPFTQAGTIQFDASKDFVAVTQLAAVDNLLVVHPAVPAKTVKDLVAVARSQKGKLNFSSTLGGYSEFDIQVLMSKAGFEAVSIPSKGAGASVVSVVGGEIDFALITVAVTMPHVKSGRLRALATTSPERLPELQEVPTMAEAGFPGIGSTNWIGFFARSGVPRSVIERLHQATAEVAARPSIRESFAKANLRMAISSSPEAFQRYVNDELSRWRRIIQDKR